MNPLQKYNYVPTTVLKNQFLSYKQPAYYMTDYRPSSDLYSYLIHDASENGEIRTGHQLRQYMQDNAGKLSKLFLTSTAEQFLNMSTPGAPNTCSGSEPGVIYSGGKILVNDIGEEQRFGQQCNVPGQSCMMIWENTPLPQQGPHCQVPPKGYYPPYSLLADGTPAKRPSRPQSPLGPDGKHRLGPGGGGEHRYGPLGPGGEHRYGPLGPGGEHRYGPLGPGGTLKPQHRPYVPVN